jgi:glycopeptide antibiotics resistance protein
LAPVGATPFCPSGGLNLLPLRSIRFATSSGIGGVVMLNIVGNLALFAPFGALFWTLTRRLVLTMVVGCALSVFIEVAQLGLGRSTDVDDVILNVVGTLLGVLLAHGARRVIA